MRTQNFDFVGEPKLDILILLLLLRTENKFPSFDSNGNNYLNFQCMHEFCIITKGWLQDVSVLLAKIKNYCELNKTELDIITDPKLEPAHRSFYLYKVIKDRDKINEVSKLLYGIYCGHECRDVQCKQSQG